MKVNNKEFEIYMDGEELVKVNGYEELEKYLNYLFDKLQLINGLRKITNQKKEKMM